MPSSTSLSPTKPHLTPLYRNSSPSQRISEPIVPNAAYDRLGPSYSSDPEDEASSRNIGIGEGGMDVDDDIDELLSDDREDGDGDGTAQTPVITIHECKWAACPLQYGTMADLVKHVHTGASGSSSLMDLSKFDTYLQPSFRQYRYPVFRDGLRFCIDT